MGSGCPHRPGFHSGPPRASLVYLDTGVHCDRVSSSAWAWAVPREAEGVRWKGWAWSPLSKPGFWVWGGASLNPGTLLRPEQGGRVGGEGDP